MLIYNFVKTLQMQLKLANEYGGVKEAQLSNESYESIYAQSSTYFLTYLLTTRRGIAAAV